MSLRVPLLRCLNSHIWKANLKRVSSLSSSAYFLILVGVFVCVGGGSCLQSTGGQPPLQACGLCWGRLARHLQGLSSEAKGIKLQRLLLVNSSWSQEVRGCLSPSLILPLLV